MRRTLPRTSRALKTLVVTMFAAGILHAHESSASVPFHREWAVTWDLGTHEGRGQSIVTDSEGNAYVAASDGWEYYLGKYSPAGAQLWTRTIATGPVFLGGDLHVAVDPSGNPVLAGTMNAQDGTSLDYFIAKFDPYGTQLWLRRFDANNDHDTLAAVAVDDTGNIYAHGHGNQSGPANVYTVRYDRDGTRIWVASYTPRDDLSCDVKVHSDGSVYVLVSTTDYATDDDIILIKYSASGAQLWLRRYNGGGASWTDDWPSRLKLDAAGNAYLVGYSELTNGGGYGLVTQKYLANGTLAWTRRYDVSSPSSGDFGFEPAGLAVDDSGQVFVSGQIWNPGPPDNDLDVVTIKYDSDGTPLWSRAYNGAFNGPDVPRDLALAPDGGVFVVAQSRTGPYSVDDRRLLLRYDRDGTLLSTEIDNESKDGLMLAGWADSVYLVGTSVHGLAHDVTIQKFSPSRGRRRVVRH